MPDRHDVTSDDAIGAWVRLVRVSQSLLSAVETELKSKGYPPLAWYDALLELRRAGAVGLRPFELQGAMLLAQYNLSRLTDRLEKAGYVRRRPHDGDRRGQLLTITPSGERLLGRMWPVYRSAIGTHFADKLGDKNAKTLGEILGRLI